MIVNVETDDEIMSCFETLSELRPKLQKDGFIQQVRAMYSEGYRMVSAVEDNRVMAVAGYKISSNFVMGKKLYIEDLVTCESARSKGLGRLLLNHLEETAKQQDCKVLHLDSGTQRHRAHKFYLTHDMQIFAFHFIKNI